MIAALMIYGLFAGSCLAVAAWAMERVLMQWHFPVRWASTVGLVSTLAFLVLAPMRLVNPAMDGGDRGVVELASAQLDRGADGRPIPISRRSPTELFPVWTADLRHFMEAPTRWSGRWLGAADAPSWNRWLAPLWIGTTATLLLVVLWTIFRARRLRSKWPLVELHEMRVRVAPNSGPAVSGVLAPEVVVPRWLLDAAPEDQRLAVAHEVAHIRARDPLLLLLGWLIVAAVPWNPAAWWLLSRLRSGIEIDCDARVLRGGTRGDRYGFFLIDVAARSQAPLPGAAALIGRRSHLERRLLAMQRVQPTARIVRCLGLCVTAATLVLAACENSLPSPSAPEPTRATVEQHLGDLLGSMPDFGLAASAAQTHILDSVDVSEELLRDLPVDSIASVEVIRGVHSESGAHNEPPGGVIQVTTRSYDRMSITEREPQSTAKRTDAVPDTIPSALRRILGGPAMPDSTAPPLIRIDDVRISAEQFPELDRLDIEKIEVIKGAAATALYGAEAASGVILITTRESP
ncbi:MAG: M56 family metallopeptidase [Gemmatimonadota bacterium]